MLMQYSSIRLFAYSSIRLVEVDNGCFYLFSMCRSSFTIDSHLWLGMNL